MDKLVLMAFIDAARWWCATARRRTLFNGVVVASLAVDAGGRFVGEPRISAPGLFDLTIRSSIA